MHPMLPFVAGVLTGEVLKDFVEPGPRRRAFRAYRAAWRKSSGRPGTDDVLRAELSGRDVLGSPTNLEAPSMQAWLAAWADGLSPRRARKQVRRQRLSDA